MLKVFKFGFKQDKAKLKFIAQKAGINMSEAVRKSINYVYQDLQENQNKEPE